MYFFKLFALGAILGSSAVTAADVKITGYPVEWDKKQTTRNLFVSITNSTSSYQAVYFSYTADVYPNFGSPILNIKKGRVVEIPPKKVATVSVGIDYQKVPTDKDPSKTIFRDFSIDSWIPFSRGPEDGNFQELFSFLREQAYQKWQGTRPFIFKLTEIPDVAVENYSGFLLRKTKFTYDSEFYTREHMPALQVGKIYRLKSSRYRKKIVYEKAFIRAEAFFREQVRDENGFYRDREEDSGIWVRTYYPEEFFNAIDKEYAAQLFKNEFMYYLTQIDSTGSYSSEFDPDKIPNR